MPNGLKEFLASATAFWRSLSNPKRFVLVLLTVIALVGAVVFPKLASEERMVPLYTRVEPEDANQIVGELEQAQVPFELTQSGTTILVPEDKLYQLRLKMAGKGLPKGGSVGFELFDENQFGKTEFEQQVNLRRAMEGELARTIASVDGVDAARVHLVMPKSSVFISKKEEASASVVVRLSNPARFAKKEVASVVHLVAAAVPGLSRGQISIVSTEGETLQRPSGTDGGFGTDALSDEAQAVASRLEAQALAQLEKVVGPGGADVRVAVVLDSSTREATKETFEPDTTALRSEHETKEDMRTESPGMQGIPGARSNLPDNDGGEQTEVTDNKNLDTTTRNSRTRNWEVDRVLEKIHTPPGSVARLSIAVLLNGTWQKKEGAPDVFVPRSEKEVEQLSESVRRAVGFDELRGDTITVAAVKFVQGEEIVGEIAGPPLPWWRHPYAIMGVLGLIVLAILLVLILVWRSSRSKRLADAASIARLQELQEAREASFDAESGEAEEVDENGEPRALPQGERLKKLLNGGPEAIAELRQEALQIAGKDPSTTAVILRAWLEQEEKAESAPQAAE